MSEGIDVGGLSVEPLYEEPLKPIHPAIGVVDGIAYVGIWIPSKVTDKKGYVTHRDLLYLVTSEDSKPILANDTVLRERGWRLEYKPVKFKNRWPMDDVVDFLNNHKSPDPVEVLNDLLAAWRAHVEFPDEREEIYHSLWDIGTYFHHLFAAYPYLYIGGVKRVGKTKVLTVHSQLAFNAIFSNNMSVPSIYRLVQNARCTLLIDETEKLSNPERAQEMRALLLAGYKRGPKVYRTEKDKSGNLHPVPYEPYSPKALANISGLEDVLEDRCKVTIMKRAKKREILNKEVDETDATWPKIRSKLYRLYLAYWKEVKACYDKLSELSEHNELVNFLLKEKGDLKEEDIGLLTGRELELWKPILALAMFVDSHSPHGTKFTSSQSSLSSLMIGLAVESARQRLVESMTETGEIILIQTLLGMVSKDGYYRVRDIREAVAKHFDEKEEWLTARWVGGALRRLGFKEKRRVGTGYEYMLRVSDVKDLAERMGVLTSEQQTEQKAPPEGGKPPGLNYGNCAVCGKPNAPGKVRGGGVVYIHPECEDKWEGPL